MKFLKKLAPHAAILIGNMYYAFWGIDRVNKTMNFINNEYTKFLLLLLVVFGLVDVALLWPLTLRQTRRSRNPGPVYVRLGLLAANGLLAVTTFVLLAADMFMEDSMIFLSEFVKVLLLALCILSLLNALQVTVRQRAAIRVANRRRMEQRRAQAGRAQGQPMRAAAGYDRRLARPSTRIPERRY